MFVLIKSKKNVFFLVFNDFEIFFSVKTFDRKKTQK